MKCPKCQFENREGAKFCIECGKKLELDCPQCGKTFLIPAEFCDECGQRLSELRKIFILNSKGQRIDFTSTKLNNNLLQQVAKSRSHCKAQ